MPRKPHSHHYIYKTTCKITKKFYIGMHSTSNLEDGYMGSGIHIWRSIKKYGKEEHIREILEFLPDRKTLADRERDIINENFLKNPFCMNIAKGGSYSGGTNGKKFSEESRKKMSQTQQIVQKRPEVIEKRKKKLIGQKRTEESREKMSQAGKGKKKTLEHRNNIAKASANRSEETHRKLSEARRKWKRSPENIAKMIKTKKEGYFATEKWKEDHKKMLADIKIKHDYGFMQKDLEGNIIKTWKSFEEFRIENPNKNHMNIVRFINSNGKRAHAYGFKWEKI